MSDDARRAAIPVVAAVVVRGERVLLCQRHDGEHLPLLWEFPGGKIDPGETPEEALVRELREELGVAAKVGAEVADILHHYPEKTVRLRFYRAHIEGEPTPHVHRAIEWVPLGELSEYAAPPPNGRVIQRLISGELQIH